jgi:hypothetical protein
VSIIKKISFFELGFWFGFSKQELQEKIVIPMIYSRLNFLSLNLPVVLIGRSILGQS